MTKIQKVDNNYKKPFLTPKNTGYAAAGALAIATIRGVNTSKPIVKSHRFWGYLATSLTLLHIGLVEYLHHKYKKM
jgi:hypothetical protein